MLNLDQIDGSGTIVMYRYQLYEGRVKLLLGGNFFQVVVAQKIPVWSAGPRSVPSGRRANNLATSSQIHLTTSLIHPWVYCLAGRTLMQKGL
jgi:hypothetical protein